MKIMVQEDMDSHLRTLKSLHTCIFSLARLDIRARNSCTEWQFILPDAVELHFEFCPEFGGYRWTEVR